MDRTFLVLVCQVCRYAPAEQWSQFGGFPCPISSLGWKPSSMNTSAAASWTVVEMMGISGSPVPAARRSSSRPVDLRQLRHERNSLIR